MAIFKISFDHTIILEGGYSDHNLDTGGKTKYGITEAVARENGYVGDMLNLSHQQAEAIYYQRYWTPNKLDAFAQLVSDEMFDTGVNQGVGTAAIYLQKSLNRLNLNGQLFTDLVADGSIGAKTIDGYNAYLAHYKARGYTIDKVVNVLIKAITICQGERYNEIVDENPSQEVFYFGWLANRI